MKQNDADEPSESAIHRQPRNLEELLDLEEAEAWRGLRREFRGLSRDTLGLLKIKRFAGSHPIVAGVLGTLGGALAGRLALKLLRKSPALLGLLPVAVGLMSQRSRGLDARTMRSLKKFAARF